MTWKTALRTALKEDENIPMMNLATVVAMAVGAAFIPAGGFIAGFAAGLATLAAAALADLIYRARKARREASRVSD